MLYESIQMLLIVLVALEGLWWIVWIGLAFSRKIFANAIFMGAMGLIWTGFAIPALISFPDAGSFLLVLVLLTIPFILLPGMVRIITEFQRGILFEYYGVS